MEKRRKCETDRDADKIKEIMVNRSANGLVYLPDVANAFLSAKVIETKDLGTHTLFFADVTDDFICPVCKHPASDFKPL